MCPNNFAIVVAEANGQLFAISFHYHDWRRAVVSVLQWAVDDRLLPVSQAEQIADHVERLGKKHLDRQPPWGSRL